MATIAHIPVTEYLQSSYEPDCDYVDGELQERHLGEQTHSIVQAAIISIFYVNRRTWGLRPLHEQRVQVSPERFRVPDLCAVSDSEPISPILFTAPVLCVEILSPEDRLQRVVTRAKEYQAMGVGTIWIIDPHSREIWTIDASGGALPMLEDALTIPGTPVRLPVAELFEEIDSAPKL